MGHESGLRRGTFVWLQVAVASWLWLGAARANAQTLYDRAPPAQRIVHRNLVALRVNPLGLVHDGRITFRQRIYASESRALRDNYVGAGLALTHSPAFLRLGPMIEAAPLSIVGVWASLQGVAYYGSFDLFQSFPNARSDFSDDAIRARGDLPDGDPLRPYSATGLEATIGVDLQLKLGPVVIRNRARFVYGRMNLRDGDRYYYDQLYDVLAPNEGFFATSDSDVLYQSRDNRFVVGLRYTGTASLGGGDEGENTMHRVGPLVSYTFSLEDGAAFNAPSVFLLAQWWVDHRYRAGQESSQALPLLAIGFQFYGDLLAFD